MIVEIRRGLRTGSGVAGGALRREVFARAIVRSGKKEAGCVETGEAHGQASQGSTGQRLESLGSSSKECSRIAPVRMKSAGWPAARGVRKGMVFTAHKGTFLEPRNMLREYYRLRAQAQLPKIRFHDLRHSAATILKMAGIPDEAIQKLLGHASVRTTQEFYMHLTPHGEKRAADKMDEIFGSVAVKVAVKTAKSSVN